MKICFDMQPLRKQKTGVGWYTYEIIKSIIRNKLFLFEGCIFTNYNDLLSELKESFQININSNKVLRPSMYEIFSRFLPISYNSIFSTNADIFHFFNFTVPKCIKGKVITTIHDLAYLKYPETIQWKTLMRLKLGLEDSIKRADKIIAVSESTKKDIINYFNVDDKKIYIASPGFNIDLYDRFITPVEAENIRRKYKLPEKYILNVATLEPRKNIVRLIKAFSILKQREKEVKLVCAGGKGWKFGDVFKLVRELDLTDDIVFAGYIEKEDITAVYKGCEFFVYPSLYEGFGMPILEAFAAGVPVITSNISSMPEVAGDAALLVNPHSVEDLYEKMKLLLDNDALKKDLIEKGNIRKKNYTWEQSANIITDIYNELK